MGEALAAPMFASKAFKLDAFVLFLVLSIGMLGFLAKNIVQWVFEN